MEKSLKNTKKPMGLSTKIFIALIAGAISGVLIHYFMPAGYIRDSVIVEGVLYVIGQGFIRVDRIEDAYGRVVKQNKPTVIDKLMTSDEAQYLTECMEEVVDSGTGGSMRWSSYNAAGKTGSAQYDNSDNVHSWFVGFAPAETPEIVVSVVLEGGYSGVSSSQYIAKAVFDAYFQ